MSDSAAWRGIWTIGIAVIVLMLIGVLTIQAVGFLWLASTLEDLPAARTVASIVVDELVEGGAFMATSSPDHLPADDRSIVITTNINEVTSRLVVRRLLALNKLDPEAPIDLYLSSPGGWGGSAFTIVDAIRAIDAPVNPYAMGLCYSSCAVILAAGTGERVASRDALLMVHANLDDSSDPYTYERLYRARYEGFWRDHGKLPEDWYPMTGDEAYYLTAEEALEFGIIDIVAAPGRAYRAKSTKRD